MNSKQRTKKKVREAERKVHENEKRARDIEHEAASRSKDIIAEAKEEASQIRQEVEKWRRDRTEKKKTSARKYKKSNDSVFCFVDQEKEMENEKGRLQEMISEETTKLEKSLNLVNKKQKKDSTVLSNRKGEASHRTHEASRSGNRSNRRRKSQRSDCSGNPKYASEVTSDTTQTVVQLESDEMKGRIIGREGRNINALNAVPE